MKVIVGLVVVQVKVRVAGALLKSQFKVVHEPRNETRFGTEYKHVVCVYYMHALKSALVSESEKRLSIS